MLRYGQRGAAILYITFGNLLLDPHCDLYNDLCRNALHYFSVSVILKYIILHASQPSPEEGKY